MMKRTLLLFLLLLGQTALAQHPQKTVKEFLKLSQSDTTRYAVSGVVTKIQSSNSGSFYLTDPTGTLMVYGIAGYEDPSLGFKQLGIMRGDTLTVVGRFTVYNGTTKEMKDGRLLSKADGPEHGLSFLDRLDRQPAFQGKKGKEAEEAFKEWVQAHLQAPADGSKGTVMVRFVVGRKGAVQEVQIHKGAAPSLNEEALRVVRSAPKWKPAKYDGQVVRMTYVIPVVFD